MQAALLIVVSLLASLPRHRAPSLNGTWALDRVRSDFGAARAPRQLVVRLDQEADCLDITMFIADANGRRVIYLEAQPPKDASTSLVWTSSEGAGEDWQVAASGELTITRIITLKSQIVRQRLILSRSSVLD